MPKSQSIPKTSHQNFWPTSEEENCLFSVNAGIDIETALEHASCFLDIARPDAAEHEAWGAAYLIDMAKGIIDSAIGSLAKGRSHGE